MPYPRHPEPIVKTSVQLTERQLAALKRVAPQRRANVAELVRQAVDLWLRVNAPAPDERSGDPPAVSA